MTVSDQEYFDKKFNGLNIKVDKLERGVYGDPDNKVKGLIDTDREQHERIKSLEDTRKKGLWVGGGILLALQGFWHLITK